MLNVDDFKNEDEVNSKIVRFNISEINQDVFVVSSSLALVNVLPPKTNNHGAMPICCFMSGPSFDITYRVLLLEAFSARSQD